MIGRRRDTTASHQVQTHDGWHRRYLAVLLLVSLLSTQVARADDAQDPASVHGSVVFLDDVSLRDGILTFDDFMTQVKENHPTLKIADVDRRLATAKRIEQQGIFDLTINSRNYFTRYNSATDLGRPEKAISALTSFDLQTRYGPRISVGQKLKALDITPPMYPTGTAGEYFLDVRLPLLRGRRINAPVAAEKKAFLGEDLASASYERSRLDLLLRAAHAYWQWVASYQKLAVEKQLFELAKFRAEAVRAAATAGDIPEIDSVEAEQEIQMRIGRLQRAERAVQAATYDLSYFLWEPNGQPGCLPGPKNLPTHLPTPVEFDKQQLQDAKLIALQMRPELKTISISRQMAQVDLELARNNLLPQLDAFVDTGYETGKYAIGPTVVAGFTLSFPFLRREAKGQVMQAELNLERLSLQERRLIQQIFLEIADAVSAINAAYQRYLAASNELEAAKTLEKGERNRLSLGDSTLFQVNRREKITAETSIQQIDLFAEYQFAVAILRAATGQL
jgi:outer membrane protein